MRTSSNSLAFPDRPVRGFSLVELTAAMAVFSLIMVLLFSLTSEAGKAWKYASSKIETFAEARDAFENMNRRLAQATLNTYWDYEPPAPAPPQRYVRQSELHFVCGKATTLLNDTSVNRPGHAVFFQAPIGYTTNTSIQGLPNLLNAWGYYLEYNSDAQWAPDFLTSTLVQERKRFRLMQMMQTSEQLSVYSYTSGNPGYNQTDWFASPIRAANPPVRPLAENVLGLVILPKLSPEEDPDGDAIAPRYAYNSRDAANARTRNQLPPLIQVTMAVVDEASILRIGNSPVASTLGMKDTLFSVSSKVDQYEKDLKQLEADLKTANLNYRIFTSTIPISSAKWSAD